MMPGSKNDLPAPSRLTFKRIRSMVEDFRKKNVENHDEIPVNIEDIIERTLKLNIQPEFGLLEQSKIEAFLSNDLTTIFIDSERYYSDVQEKRTRFTLAHEIGHYVLHSSVYESLEFTDVQNWIEFCQRVDQEALDWYEIQASEFAGRLLVPLPKLQEEVEKLRSKISDLVLKLHNDDKNDYDPEFVEDYVKETLGRVLSDAFMVSSKSIETRIKREGIFAELGITFTDPR